MVCYTFTERCILYYIAVRNILNLIIVVHAINGGFKEMGKYFATDGVRGKANEGLTLDMSIKIGQLRLDNI